MNGEANVAFGGDVMDQMALKVLTNLLTMRRGMGIRDGFTHDNQRDIYQACGYPDDISAVAMYAKYSRGDIARRIVDAYPKACWSAKPMVWDSDADEESEFEKAWTNLYKTKRLARYFSKVDRLGGIGRYGCLYLGMDDAESQEDLQVEIKKGSKLVFTQAFREDTALIGKFVTAVNDPRYGQAESYNLQTFYGLNPLAGAGARTAQPTANPGPQLSNILSNVHWTRVLHIAEDPDDGELYGTPRQKVVWNRLLDIETMVSATGETFWRTGFPRTVYDVAAEARLSEADRTKLEARVQDMIFGLRDFMFTQGVKPQVLSGQTANPQVAVQTCLWLISAATGIPYRILTGSEQGELAGSQDQDNWHNRVDIRRKDHCAENILRPFIERLVEFEVLPRPLNDDFTIEWDEVDDEKPSDKYSSGLVLAQAVSAYMQGGVENAIPIKAYLCDIMGFDQTEVEGYLDEVEKNKAEKAKEVEQTAKLAQQKMPGEEPANTVQFPKPAAEPKVMSEEDLPSMRIGARVNATLANGLRVNGEIVDFDEAFNAIMETEEGQRVLLPMDVEEV